MQEDGVKSFRTAVCGTALSVAALLLLTTPLWPQDAASGASSGQTDPAVRELKDQVRELRSMVDEMRTENAESRAEMQRLREDLQATRALLQQAGQSTAVSNQPPSS